VESGETPSLFGVDPPKPRMEVVRIVDMSTSNACAESAAVFAQTKAAHANLVSFADAQLRIPIVCALRKAGRSAARSVTSSLCRYAVVTIASFIDAAMKPRGGNVTSLTASPLRESFG
jgi:hypothetical protein